MRVTWSNTYNADTALTAATLTADIELNVAALQLHTYYSTITASQNGALSAATAQTNNLYGFTTWLSVANMNPASAAVCPFDFWLGRLQLQVTTTANPRSAADIITYAYGGTTGGV